MSDYSYRYRLQSAPEARNDGSGNIDHDIYAEAREDGSEDAWVTVPGRHQTISVPADELQTVMDMPDTGAKVTAYKQALVDNLNTQPTPVTGWSLVQLEAMMDANDAATAAATAANTYITVTLSQEYPVEFTI